MVKHPTWNNKTECYSCLEEMQGTLFHHYFPSPSCLPPSHSIFNIILFLYTNKSIRFILKYVFRFLLIRIHRLLLRRHLLHCALRLLLLLRCFLLQLRMLPSVLSHLFLVSLLLLRVLLLVLCFSYSCFSSSGSSFHIFPNRVVISLLLISMHKQYPIVLRTRVLSFNFLTFVITEDNIGRKRSLRLVGIRILLSGGMSLLVLLHLQIVLLLIGFISVLIRLRVIYSSLLYFLLLFRQFLPFFT